MEPALHCGAKEGEQFKYWGAPQVPLKTSMTPKFDFQPLSLIL